MGGGRASTNGPARSSAGLKRPESWPGFGPSSSSVARLLSRSPPPGCRRLPHTSFLFQNLLCQLRPWPTGLLLVLGSSAEPRPSLIPEDFQPWIPRGFPPVTLDAHGWAWAPDRSPPSVRPR